MDERYQPLTSFGDGLADLIDQNSDYLDAYDRLVARLDTMAATLSKLPSDSVCHGHFDAENKALQGQILDLSLPFVSLAPVDPPIPTRSHVFSVEQDGYGILYQL
jgi:hypothetical protein